MEQFPTERADIDPREGLVDLIESVEGLKEKVPVAIRNFIAEQVQVGKEYMLPSVAAPALWFCIDQSLRASMGTEYSDYSQAITELQEFVFMSSFLLYQGVRKALPAIQRWKTRNERTQSQPVS